ncbi:MAG: phosphoenolpyruvate synthase [Gammaproteobacteria bacterium]|nr:phosphoenolpyruvate synthase [Gammaproteobacteria bacterium]
MQYIVNLNAVNSSHVKLVGGKNASLGEMIQFLTSLGIKVPDGFATTIDAYREFLSHGGLDKKITKACAQLKVNDIAALEKTAKQIQRMILETPFPKALEEQIEIAYSKLNNPTVAVRSSATTEDLAVASFAGQQETFLNIKGYKNVLLAIKMVFASLFSARAITYRSHQGFDLCDVAISAGIQPMIRSDKGVSGVMFTLDTESGFDQVILLSASYGLGEAIVQGHVNPDEFFISKPLLEANRSAILQRRLGTKVIKMIYTQEKSLRKTIKTVAVKEADRLRFCLDDNDVKHLAQQALIIEKHYGKPMDIEWAKDGITGEIFILQARHETVRSNAQEENIIERYYLEKKTKIITKGQSVGQRIGQGNAKIILDPKNMHVFKTGEVLVTNMTNPDWEPIMKRASAIVTNRGGRTCHAAIIARELGIPAVIGCSNATKRIKEGSAITVSCAGGQVGYVYKGLVPFQVKKISIDKMPDLPLKLCINLGNPDNAFTTRFLPNHGVGLARLEFIISNTIGIHPNTLLNFNFLPKKLQEEVDKKTQAYASPKEFYIEKLREGISTIAAAFYPKQVIFRFSDFKSNEYANLLGGDLFEPNEENPMIGYRGASRYKDKNFTECFALECLAFTRVRDQMGLTNAQIMIPFVRTIEELKQVLEIMEKHGLKRGKNNLKVYMMCEIPSNVLLAKEFLKHVDGFSIGSNDLTQLTLGLDRDSNLVASLFDERNEAIKILLHLAISECLKQGKYIGICGQGPSDHPDFAEWLVNEGIQNISLNPDTIVETWLMIDKKCFNKKKLVKVKELD